MKPYAVFEYMHDAWHYLHCYRYIEILHYGIKSRLDKDPDSRDKIIEVLLKEDSQVTFLRLLEGFMESAPQLTLQLYILFTYGSEEALIIRKYHVEVFISISIVMNDGLYLPSDVCIKKNVLGCINIQ